MKLQKHPISRQFSKIKSLKRITSALLPMSLLLCAGCTDDFEPVIPTSGDPIEFAVSTSNGWTSPTRSRAAEPTQSLPRDTCYTMQSNGGKAMYLHTRTEYNTENLFMGNGIPSSRGTLINNINEYGSFGLFAGIYESDWNEEDYGANYIFNVECKNTSGNNYAPTNSYYWPGMNQNIRFWGYAPYNHPNITLSNINDLGSPYITYVVPQNNEDQIDIITVMADGAKDGDGAQTLTFKHALTAIQFVLADDVKEGSIKNISINGVYSKATNIIGNNVWFDHNDLTDFNLEYNPAHITGQQNTSTNIATKEKTFIMIPQTLPTSAEIVVEFIDFTNTLRTLHASIANTEWKPGTIITYHISTSSILYLPKLLLNKDSYIFPFSANPQSYDFLVSSYTEVSQVDGPTTYRAEPFKIDILDEVDNPILFDDDSTPFITTSTLMQDNFEDNTDAYSRPSDHILSVGALTKYQFEDTPVCSCDEELKKAEIGSINNPVNLADINNSGLETTANCYLVNTPGYYEIPLVYGNALVNGIENTSAFTKVEPYTSTTPYTNYVNYKGDIVKQPYIYIDSDISSGEIVWQDVKNLISSIYLSPDKKYLRFYISKEHIHEGNAVIAITDSKNIIWSWHIWVTPYNTNDDVTFSYNGKSYSFMSNYLGFCHPANRKYPNRNVKIKLTQTRTGKDTELLITLTGKIITDVGNSVYYQWGRKDALPGQILDWQEVDGNLTLRSEYKQIYDGASNTITQPLLISKVSIAESISNPACQATTKNRDGDVWHIGTTVYQNLWNNIDRNNVGTTKTVKTIYDPSPVGYCVAPGAVTDLFKGLTISKDEANIFYYWVSNNPNSLNLSWTLRKNSVGYFNTTSKRDYPTTDCAFWISNFHSRAGINQFLIGTTNCILAFSGRANVALPLLPMRQN